MAACGNFEEQLWRKGKCANCFQPKEKHRMLDTLKNAGEETSVVSNVGPKRTVKHSNSYKEALKTSSGKSTKNLISKELKPDENTTENGDELAMTCSTQGTSKSCEDHCLATNVSNTDRDSKVFLVNKPKPVPRPKPRPFSRVGDSTICDKSREGNLRTQEPVGTVSSSDSFEIDNSLGKSHNESQCNATSSKICEGAGISTPACSGVHGDTTDEGNIERVCDKVKDEGLNKDAIELSDNMDLVRQERYDIDESVSKISESDPAATDILELEFVDSDDDNDAYVSMKNNMTLINVECTKLQSNETDVINTERDNRGKQSVEANNCVQSDEGSPVSRQSKNEDTSPTSVLEFKNPLFQITDDMGDTLSSTVQVGEPVDCGKVSPRCKSSIEPCYENRPASIESETGSSQDSGYENIRKSTRSDSSNSASDPHMDINSNVNTPYVSKKNESLRVVFSEPDSSVESSGTSCSSWGSITWDSCSASDFHETSCDSHNPFPVKPGGKASLTKSCAERVTIKSEKKLSNLGVRDEVDWGHMYMNADVKPMTRPYKVVDISTGCLVPTSEIQTNVPPLPPKEKDLKKNKPEEVIHEYLEPSEDIKDIPDQQLSAKSPKSVPNKESVSGSSSNTTSSTVTDMNTPVRRTPAPRPRSRVPSQFGTLPKPAPRASRLISDVPVKVETERGGGDLNPVVTSCVATKASDDIPPPSPPPLSRLPSLRKSSSATTPSPPSPRKSILECNPESTGANNSCQISAVRPLHEGEGIEGKSQEDPIKPKRSAPPPPPSASSPPPKSPTPQPVEPSLRPSPVKVPPTQSPTANVSSPNNSGSLPKASSPKSTFRRAFATMKKLGSKKKAKRSRTIEISGPIAVNDEVPGSLTQKEELRRRAMSEGVSPSAEQVSIAEPSEVEAVEDSSPPVSVSAATILAYSATTSLSPESSSPTAANVRSSGTCSPVMGYQNFPLSKGGDTLERPKKPPRLAKVVKPLQHSPPEANEAVKQVDEEPTYLEPNEDELTLKVEVALANLNDAELLAEALSRVEQEKLGPLPAIPRPRHVHFRCETSADSVARPSSGKPQLPRRPVRVVSPTLINGSGDKSESKSRPPKLPSRPPNTKTSLHVVRERCHSLEGRAVGKPVSVVRSRSLSSSSNILEKRYNKILKLQMQTLEEMLNSWREELLPNGEVDLSDTRWSDYEVCGDVLGVHCSGAVLASVKCAKYWEGNKKLLAKVQYPLPSMSHVLQRSPFKQDMRVCEALSYHVNVSRVLTHFTDDVSGDVIEQPDCDSYETIVSISDQMPCETVADFLRRTRDEHESDPERYEKKVCLLLLQLLSGIEHLQREAVVHRDLKLENLFLLDSGLLVVANFEHALHQDKNTQPSPFILSTSVSSHLGGNLEHLPPEIITAPEDADALNYEECDSFAAGCLVYELLHRSNPFAVNPNLIQQKYQESDLPPLPLKSRFSRGLCMIARQLLQRHPQERMSAAEAIQMLQVLIWGPRDLEDDDTESAIGDWLETERAHMVASIARNQRSCNSDEFMEMFLKCQFLVDGEEDVTSFIYHRLKPHI